MKVIVVLILFAVQVYADWCVSGTGGDGVRIRSYAGTGAPTLRVAAENERCKEVSSNVVAANGYNWRNIDCSGTSGWAATNFLVYCSSPVPPTPSGNIVLNRLPFDGNWGVSQFYGYTKFAAANRYVYYTATQGMHNGIDFAMNLHTPLKAVCDGLVVWAGEPSPFAAGPKSVILRCGNWYILYGHVSSVSVYKGQSVSTGTQVGTSGFPDGPHLHFEIRPVPNNLINNWDANSHPSNPGYCVNPKPFFSTSLAGYFNSQYTANGGKSSYCTGDWDNQPNIYFGAAVKENACTN